jgi:hypothetical protein
MNHLQINHKKKPIGGVQYYIKRLSSEFSMDTRNITNWFGFFLFLLFSLINKKKIIISHSFKYSFFLSLIRTNNILIIHDNFEAIKSNYLLYYKFILKSRLKLIVFSKADRKKFEGDNWKVISDNFCVPLKISSKVYNTNLDKKPTLLYYGRISNSQKCCDELLAYARQSALNVLFVGPFGDVNSVADYSVFYGGVVSNLEELLVKISGKKIIGISFSDHEGMPISMFELVNMGIPFVSTPSADSISYYFESTKIGEIIDKSNYKDVKAKIKLIDDNYEFYSSNCVNLNINKTWKDSWRKLLT